MTVPPMVGGWVHHKTVLLENCSTACTTPVAHNHYGITFTVIYGVGIGLQKLVCGRLEGPFYTTLGRRIGYRRL